MRAGSGRVLVAALGCLLWLSGCETSIKLGDAFGGRGNDPSAANAAADPDSTGSIRAEPTGSSSGIAGKSPDDAASLGQKYYSAGMFGLAEQQFRKAVERNPNNAEAWVGLAAAYDRLKRFDLADRAYAQAIAILGPTPEILNNQGYSYILRRDYTRARRTLLAAQAKDPDNPYIQNNLELLNKSAGRGKAGR